MQRVLPLTTVQDTYTTFSCPGTEQVYVQAFNNGIDIGFGYGYPAAIYPPSDEYLALTSAILHRRCDEIRFQNHVPGNAAQIQITTIGGEEGHPLGEGGYTSNFLTINPDGTVGASFTGAVTALGLVLPTGALFSQTSAQIVWERTLGNRSNPPSLSAQIASTDVSGITALDIYSYGASGDASQNTGRILLHSSQAGGGSAVVVALQSDGRSNFLQLLSLLKLRLQVGNTGLVTIGTWTAGTWYQQTVAHSLGVIPAAFGGLLIGTGGPSVAGAVPVTSGTADASNLVFQLFNTSAFNLSGGTFNLNWWAIG